MGELRASFMDLRNRYLLRRLGRVGDVWFDNCLWRNLACHGVTSRLWLGVSKTELEKSVVIEVCGRSPTQQFSDGQGIAALLIGAVVGFASSNSSKKESRSELCREK